MQNQLTLRFDRQQEDQMDISHVPDTERHAWQASSSSAVPGPQLFDAARAANLGRLEMLPFPFCCQVSLCSNLLYYCNHPTS